MLHMQYVLYAIKLAANLVVLIIHSFREGFNKKKIKKVEIFPLRGAFIFDIFFSIFQN